MKEILEALGTRLSSPLFGYGFFAFIAINWKPLFYVLASPEDASIRIAYFEANTDLYSLAVLPIVFAMIGAIIYPWVKYGFLYLNKKPTVLRNTLQAESEHSLLLKKQELEKLRANVLADKESELIDRAKRDSELEKIEDEEIRDKLKKEIEDLRSQRNQIDLTAPENNESSELRHLSELANNLSSQAELEKMKGDLAGSEKYLHKARAIQERLIHESRNEKPNN